ncbi:endonuclease/exonuclease/phosphatase family protein [Gaoshiqia sp. Z1-71]|uniref:endonuclease/exonuclease/phosphatase family protein n=1 Tax=Gaoshiqia hydrogeniformans TaxID=3290090 RepID=UPI003BF82D43
MKKTEIYVAVLLFMFLSCKNKQDGSIRRIRLVSYNIEFFAEAGALEIARMLHTYRPDLIALQEVPVKEGFQSERDVQKALDQIEDSLHTGIKWYCYTGKIGSGNDDRKYKSILSRTPLTDTLEVDLMPPGGRRGASAVRGITVVSGIKISVYSLHTPAAPHYKQTLVNSLALTTDSSEVVIVMGDFNERLYGKGDSALRSSGFIPIWDVLGIDVTQNRTYDARGIEPDAGVIDHLFLKGKVIRVTAGGIIELEKALSDHCPVWAELTIVREKGEKARKTPLKRSFE